MENLSISEVPINQISEVKIFKSKSDLEIVKEMLEKNCGKLTGQETINDLLAMYK